MVLIRGAAQSYRDEIAIIDGGHALYPDEVVAKSGTRRIAGRDFEPHLQTRAVTEGDVWLYDPATRTLVAGAQWYEDQRADRQAAAHHVDAGQGRQCAPTLGVIG